MSAPVVARAHAQPATPAREGAAGALPVWVFGAGGLMAGELLRLCAQHPGLALAGTVTRAGGEELGALHPQLARAGRTLAPAAALDALAAALAPEGARALLVLALPHGEAAHAWRAARERLGAAAERALVLDLSADHRLDAAGYRAWYGEHPDPDALASFVYGLPELARDALAGATRIAAPGCFATALQLATLPAARAGLLDADRPWIYHALTGSSGSGARPSAGTHHPHRHANVWAYAREGHRHEAELARALAPLGLAPAVVFAPHSGPFVRGICLTAFLPLARALATDEARAAYERAYAGAPFVDVLAEAPDLHRVVGSNRAALSAVVRERVLVVSCTLDNLVKGGSGQALQALNLALGWPETTGLPQTALGAL